MLARADHPPQEHPSQGGRGAGYRLQMLMKLAVAKIVPTDFYLTLDADVLLMAPLRLDRLLPDGGSKAVLWGQCSQHRPSWFSSAAAVLRAHGSCQGAPSSSHRKSRQQFVHPMGVTPSLLSTSIARGLLADITAQNHSVSGVQACRGYKGQLAWDTTLFCLLDGPGTGDWTEYALYYVYACKAGLLEARHAEPRSPWVDQTGFQWGALQNFHAETAAQRGYLLSVIQSIGGSSPLSVALKLSNHLL